MLVSKFPVLCALVLMVTSAPCACAQDTNSFDDLIETIVQHGSDDFSRRRTEHKFRIPDNQCTADIALSVLCDPRLLLPPSMLQVAVRDRTAVNIRIEPDYSHTYIWRERDSRGNCPGSAFVTAYVICGDF